MKLSETQAKVLARIIFTGSASWSSANDRTRDSLIRLNLAAEYHAHTLLLIPTALGVRAYADHIDEEPMMIAARVMGRIEAEAYAEKAEREQYVPTERFAYPNDIVTVSGTFSVLRVEGDRALLRSSTIPAREVWVPIELISPASLPTLPGGTTPRKPAEVHAMRLVGTPEVHAARFTGERPVTLCGRYRGAQLTPALNDEEVNCKRCR